MASLAQKVGAGIAPTQQEINVLGQFDVVLGAMLDAAYERADQKYRNAFGFWFTGRRWFWPGIGGWIVYGSGPSATVWGYFGGWQFWLSLLVGLSATPLAPMAKDLASSLQSGGDRRPRGQGLSRR